MAGLPLPTQLPPTLRPIAHFLKIGTEHETRDPVVAYWCRLAALQAALKLDKKSPEATKVLIPLMDWLEKEKRALSDNEAVTSEVVACAHIDNFALKLFLWADREDRAARFSKNVVKAFYTAGNLYEVLNILGELSPENAHHRDYAKWKAAYIHNCLKNGEAPIPGPIEGSPEAPAGMNQDGSGAYPPQVQNLPTGGYGGVWSEEPSDSSWNPQPVPAPRGAYAEINLPSSLPSASAKPTPEPSSSSGTQLSVEMTAKAQKYCKFASSSLDYDDTTTAIDYLEKALRILKTGKE